MPNMLLKTKKRKRKMLRDFDELITNKRQYIIINLIVIAYLKYNSSWKKEWLNRLCNRKRKKKISKIPNKVSSIFNYFNYGLINF